MPTQLIVRGRVQGVFCRAYCSQYGKKFKVRGAASNHPDGSVRIILNTEDTDLITSYIDALKNNPSGFRFFGRIEEVDRQSYQGRIQGDYTF